MYADVNPSVTIEIQILPLAGSHDVVIEVIRNRDRGMLARSIDGESLYGGQSRPSQVARLAKSVSGAGGCVFDSAVTLTSV
ncbi:hypothetical protein Sinac_2144 [Singulisphaera acidiphila DSM 18658]|uniref:Uncharacterized protein n=1 Tax=Singulisphaera acidiphila (strain ATCC BAA-1392 / DSM 18658 / VKM B-2454 / MOB10) TaxID=886293 RepID=L0DB62_SINAD|nr:hypothetical protein Sinac_2144 [Singulisphaera acidiphila DSM 18658]